jgi:calpain-7
VLVEPKSDRKLPTSEQILLLRASQLNGFKFPPWTNAPQDSDFRLSNGQERFT